MTTITVEMFIGSDNVTGHVDTDTLYRVLDARREGYTVTSAVGAWRGQREESVRVVLAAESDAVDATLIELRDALHQEAVAYRQISDLRFI
jgi:hypothetical protein